ncbi:nucleotidyltransferase family protein [Arcobacter cryaerophilus gv. pseudocryaerophilus]|uniref:Nucleotidyltransferase family protein n=3 Tax=unclassified Arcobacter TaxID=2593671 RepID=A0AA96L1W1_9BACT|nr:nucleotidyltransferase family protein [Arcobacter sp. AZ-2023]WPD05187.1 nucleotidyltransferase family protein [Arcobacter sp. DSM 115956]WPD07281.1 nucleotidyltransferase family protein [Arcobacter sp. DSM 115955]WNL31546.1 nucleotidyltransferase family protein [Arcobacter sp. AZ-2023]WNP37696.1 nucleotidyltransferase family protein [Arcobacter sp. AZ-2023]
MKSINNIKLKQNATIKEALAIIDKAAMQIALIIDENDKLIGTITDGDIRRGLLKGLVLNSSIQSIIFTTPTICKVSDTKEDILKIALSKKLHQIPIVDDDGKVLGIQEIEELIKPKDKINKVILMVGGLGTRLRPLTETTPKPMLKVGNKPILQTIVEKFAEYGYTNIVMCVNYKSDIIQDYFKDGSDFGVNIEYILEEQRMGTAGALSLLKDKPNEPFFVMNGDLLTNVNFEHLHNYHIATNSMATMCVREYDFQVPYGVVNIKDSKIVSIEEKPIHKFFVSAGIYMLSSEVLNYIPKNEFFDMPTLFEKLISLNQNTVSFPIREYWLDIGRMEEYKKANDEYGEMF